MRNNCPLSSGEINKVEQRVLWHLLHKMDSALDDIAMILEDMRNLTAPYCEQIDVIDSIPGFDQESSMKIIAEISAEPQEYFFLLRKFVPGPDFRPATMKVQVKSSLEKPCMETAM